MTHPIPITTTQGEAILAKASRRLLPLLFISYVVAYLDRINVSFAALTMRSDLQLDAAAFGIWGAFGFFWALASSFLGSTAAAAGIALINSFGNLGGFVGPALMGYSKDLGGYAGGLGAIALFLLAGAGMTALVRTGKSS